jgi:hypothetical protein
MTERDDPDGAVEPSNSPAPYGDNGFLEDYTAQVPRRAHRLPWWSAGEKFAGTPMPSDFLTSES